jgi:hypothetical protein
MKTGELRHQRATETSVISLYLNVPVDLAEQRGLLTRARDLIRGAAGDQVTAADLEAIGRAITANGQEWLGRTMAIFACAELGLFEVISLPGPVSDQAVIAAKPYIRPLLAAVQRNPPYQVAVIDTKHAWLLGVADDEVDTLAERTGREVPSTRFAGWYGLEAYRMEQRIMELSRKHYKDTITVLEQLSSPPLVLGGQETQVSRFTAMLPAPVRDRVAGRFSLDLQTATPARVRELAGPVIADWEQASEAQLVNDVLGEPPGTSVVTDLAGCLAAVRSRAVSQLVLPDDEVVPGCACDDCGALGLTLTPGDGSCDCPDPAASCRAVPDVLDELTSQALDGGSEVTAVRDAPFTAAARLRFSPGSPGV